MGYQGLISKIVLSYFDGNRKKGLPWIYVMADQTMQAALLHGFGEPEVLKLGTVPRPSPKKDDLLVRVKATALNRADILQRRGVYPPPPGESDILGLELAGEVVGWGSNVTGFSQGMEVFGLVGGGGYAEYALLDHKMAMPIPTGWSFQQAAAVPEVFITANETVFVLGGLQPKESMLLHAGGSGVGTATIQMAASIGATVYFTAGSMQKIESAMALGASKGIHYKTQDFVEEVFKLTQQQGVHLVEDFLGASYLARNLKCLRTQGRLVLVALMGGAKAEINLSVVLRRRLKIMGSVLRSRTLEEKREATTRLCERWLPLLASGKIKPILDTEFSLKDAAAAHRHMEANANFGKIILTV